MSRLNPRLVRRAVRAHQSVDPIYEPSAASLAVREMSDRTPHDERQPILVALRIRDRAEK